MKGIICAYSPNRKRGFIQIDTMKDNICFYLDQAQMGEQNLRVGTRVVCDIVEVNQQPRAVNVQVICTRGIDSSTFLRLAAVYILLILLLLVVWYAEVKVFWVYLLGVNFGAFVVFYFDKMAARAGATRVPEKLFYLIALLGASPAILIGMPAFRHKTRKASFQLKLGLIVSVQVVILLYFLLD